MAFAICTIQLFSAEDFAAREFKGKNDGKLLYRIHLPENLPKTAKCPLILVLHGAGERGNDNKCHIARNYGPIELMKYSKDNNENAIIIAPQVPKKQQWVDVPWGGLKHTMPEKPSAVMQLTLELLDKVIDEMQVDRNRVYVTGLSMGGYGTWDIIQRRPKLFAAAMPICGGGDTAMADKIKDIPIWAFHGARDRVVKPSRTKDMIEAIRKAGGNPKVSIFPGTKHDSWKQVYRDWKKQYLPWFFAQKKKSDESNKKDE